MLLLRVAQLLDALELVIWSIGEIHVMQNKPENTWRHQFHIAASSVEGQQQECRNIFSTVCTKSCTACT